MTTQSPPRDEAEEGILRIKNSSDPTVVAQAISNALYDGHQVVLRAIGAGAVNQAVKACAIARGYVAPRGLDLFVKPGFDTVHFKDGERTAITFQMITS